MARRPKMGQRDRRVIWDWEPKFPNMAPGTRLTEPAPSPTTAPGAQLPEPAPVPTTVPAPPPTPRPAPAVVPDTVDVSPMAPIETLEAGGERDITIKDAEFKEWLKKYIKELQRQSLNDMRDLQVFGASMFTGMVTGNFGPFIVSPLMMYNDFLTFDSYNIQISITPPDATASGTISFNNSVDNVDMILSDALMSINPGTDNITALDIGTTTHRYKDVDIYGTTDVNFVAYGNSAGYPRGYVSAEQGAGVYGKASMLAAYSALNVAALYVYADSDEKYIQIDADEILPYSTGVTNLGRSTLIFDDAYFDHIYYNSATTPICTLGKRNLYLGKDAIAKFKNIKAINIDGNWAKTDPGTIPEDLKGPVVDWGDEKQIQTMDMIAWSAYVLAGLIDLEERITTLENA